MRLWISDPTNTHYVKFKYCMYAVCSYKDPEIFILCLCMWMSMQLLLEWTLSFTVECKFIISFCTLVKKWSSVNFLSHCWLSVFCVWNTSKISFLNQAMHAFWDLLVRIYEAKALWITKPKGINGVLNVVEDVAIKAIHVFLNRI